MALTITARGTAVNTTSASTFAFSPNSNFTAGQRAVLVLSYENSGTDGADPYSSIADSVGNTWTRHQNSLNDPGAANEGVAFGIFSTPQDIGQITSSTTITITYTTNVPGDAACLWEISSDTGTVSYLTGGADTAYTAASALTTGTINVGQALICGLGKPGNASTTEDTDTTNGTWATEQWAAAGFNYANTSSQGKVQTTTNSTQTWNISWSGNSYIARGWAVFTEIAVYNSFAQAQANIKQIYSVYSQAQAQLLNNSTIYSSFAQTQAQVKQTYQVYAQSETWIKQEYQVLAQAETRIKQEYQVFAQALTLINATYQSYGQAQTQIKTIYEAYAQAEAKINAYDIRVYAQAEAYIAGQITIYAQAQALIKTEYQAFAQAVGAVKNNYLAHAQGQAHIKITDIQGYSQAGAYILKQEFIFAQAQTQMRGEYRVYGQAQAYLPSLGPVTYGQYGQAFALIGLPYFTVLHQDTFTRTVSNGWGTPDVGTPYTLLYTNDPNSTWQVNGSKGTVTNNAGDTYGGIEFRFGNFPADYEIYFETVYSGDGDTSSIYSGNPGFIFRDSDPNNYWSNGIEFEFYNDLQQISGRNSSGWDYLEETLDYLVTYAVKLKFEGAWAYAKWWPLNGTEPSEWKLSFNIDDPLDMQPGFILFPIYVGHSSAYAARQEFDNILVTGIGFLPFNLGFSQSQALIKQTYLPVAQAQTILNQSMYVAQAAASIKQTYPFQEGPGPYAQAQAWIKKGWGFGQAQARIPHILDSYGEIVRDDGASHLYGFHAFTDANLLLKDEIGIIDGYGSLLTTYATSITSPVAPEKLGASLGAYSVYLYWALSNLNSLPEFTQNNWSVEAWVKSPSATDVKVGAIAVAGGVNFYHYFNVYFGSPTSTSNVGSSIGIVAGDSNGQLYYSSGITYTPSTWYHIVITYSNQVFKVYIDGNLNSTITRLGWTETSTINRLVIGRIYTSGYVTNTSNYFIGLDNLAVYPTTLSDETVSRHNIDGLNIKTSFAQAQVKIGTVFAWAQAHATLNQSQYVAQANVYISPSFNQPHFAQAKVYILPLVYGQAQAVIHSRTGITARVFNGQATSITDADINTLFGYYEEVGPLKPNYSSSPVVSPPIGVPDGSWNTWGIIWTANFIADETGTWSFWMRHDDWAYVGIKNWATGVTTVVRNNTGVSSGELWTISLTEGQQYTLVAGFSNGTGAGYIEHKYSRPSDGEALHYLTDNNPPWILDSSRYKKAQAVAWVVYFDPNSGATIWPRWAQSLAKIYYPDLQKYAQAQVQIGSFKFAQARVKIVISQVKVSAQAQAQIFGHPWYHAQAQVQVGAFWPAQAQARIYSFDIPKYAQAQTLIQDDHGLVTMIWTTTEENRYQVGTIIYWGKEGYKGEPTYRYTGDSQPEGWPGTNTDWGMAWSGVFIADETGTWQFELNSEDGSDLWINNTRVVDNEFGIDDGDLFNETRSGSITLTQGELYTIHSRFAVGVGTVISYGQVWWEITIRYKRPSDSTWQYLTSNNPPWIREYWYAGFAQAQVYTIGGQNFTGHAQAQAQMLGKPLNFAQAQTTILRTYRIRGQAQVQIGAFRPAQALALIERTSYSVAQAGTQIGSFKYSQAKAWIKAYEVSKSAQAQALIEKTREVNGQTQAQIKQTYPLFRLSPNYATANYGASIDVEPIVDGIGYTIEGFPSYVLDENIHTFWTSLVNPEGTYTTLANIDLGTSRTISGYYILPNRYNATVTLEYKEGAVWTLVDTIYFDVGINDPVDANKAYRAIIGPITARYWRLTVINGGNDLKISLNSVELGVASIINPTFAQAAVQIGFFAFAQAVVGIYPMGQRFGQAHSTIKQIYREVAQAQAYILVPTVFGLAKTHILQTYFSVAQAIFFIIPPTTFGLALATIAAYDVNRVGQAQAIVINIYYTVGQAHATITKSAGYGYSQTLIRSRVTLTGQSRVSIGHFQYGLARVFIVAQNRYAQALAIIKASYIKSAQAVVMIQRFERWGQAKTSVIQTYRRAGLAQALLNTGFGLGQAITLIVRVYSVQANSRVWTKTTYMQFSQALTSLFEVRTYTAQANAHIFVLHTVTGNATAQIGYFKYAQAQTRVLAFNVPKVGNAGCYILVDTTIPNIDPSSDRSSYLVSYENQRLPGYARSESFDSVINILGYNTPYKDGDITYNKFMYDHVFAAYHSLENKSISLVMTVWEATYEACKLRVEEAATILRSIKGRYGKLYIQDYDRYYLVIPKSLTIEKEGGTSPQLLQYSVLFEARPWLIGNENYTIRTIPDFGQYKFGLSRVLIARLEGYANSQVLIVRLEGYANAQALIIRHEAHANSRVFVNRIDKYAYGNARVFIDGLPDAPSGLAAFPGDSRVTLTWNLVE